MTDTDRHALLRETAQELVDWKMPGVPAGQFPPTTKQLRAAAILDALNAGEEEKALDLLERMPLD